MRRSCRLDLAALAALIAAAVLACSGDSRSAPAPPPAPPPFQPTAVVVDLGTKGGKTTLLTTQAGGWTRNGEPFRSGDTVTGENSAAYKLTLSGGRWTAEFVAPDPVAVPLGTSGDSLALQVQEDGSYRLGDQAFPSGEVVRASNGSSYRLTQDSEGKWTAAFVDPPPVLVRLGTSGAEASLRRQEDGSYLVAGKPLGPDTVVSAPNGNQYRISRAADGTWVAAFVPKAPEVVVLGTSGDTVQLVRREDGTYSLGGQTAAAGTVVRAGNGNSYRLRVGLQGRWEAVFVAGRSSLALGNHGGTLTLTRQEDGSWRNGDAPIRSGDVVTGSNGFSYKVTRSGTEWFAEPIPRTVEVDVPASSVTIGLVQLEDGTYLFQGRALKSGDEIVVGGSTYAMALSGNRWTAEFLFGNVSVPLGTRGDSITLVKLADGTYQLDGRQVRSGQLVTSPGTGIRYRITLRGDQWTSSVYTPPTFPEPGGGTAPGSGTVSPATEDLLTLLPATYFSMNAFNFSSTALVKTGQSDIADKDYSRYVGSGSIQDRTFVSDAVAGINKVLDPIVNGGLDDGTDSERRVAALLVRENWNEARDALRAIFGTAILSDNPPSGSLNGIDLDVALSSLKGKLDDLSTLAKFTSAFSTQIGSANAGNVFKARKRVAGFGATQHTRFGVVGAPTQSTSTALTFAGGSGAYQGVGFAYSPLSASAVASLPTRGTAHYVGSTWAIEPSSLKTYFGKIELFAALGIERITSKVTELAERENGTKWVHDNKNVLSIDLPLVTQAQLADTGKFTSATSVQAQIAYEAGGGLFTSNADSSLTGSFVGTASSGGQAVLGKWNIKSGNTTLLDAGFGADQSVVNPARLPAADSTGTVSNLLASDASTSISGTNLVADSMNFSLATLFSTSTTAASTSGNDTVTVRPRSTSYTRFGSWVKTTTGSSSTSRGFYSFSPVSRTVLSGSGDQYYPRRVVATYNGATVATDSAGVLYDGTYSLSVDWTQSTPQVVAIVSNLVSISNSSPFSLGGVNVTQIGFQDAATPLNSSGSTPNFTAPTSVRVQYASGATETLAGSGQAHAGFFAGLNGVDGPVAVVGSWKVTKGSKSIEGAFGADLVTSP